MIEYLVKKGLSRKALEKADQNFIKTVYNKFQNPYKYEEGEYKVTKQFLKQYYEKYGMQGLKNELDYYFRTNRMSDWVKTAKYIMEVSKANKSA